MLAWFYKLSLFCSLMRSHFTHETLQWRHNGHDGISNHQPHHCLFDRLVRLRSKKMSNFHITGLCAGNSPVTGEFPAQMASNAENVSIWWRHHEMVFWHRFHSLPVTEVTLNYFGMYMEIHVAVKESIMFRSHLFQCRTRWLCKMIRANDLSQLIYIIVWY